MTARTDGPRIAELPEVVRNQIAAGEVVERPASVVKELVENALDAGATRVRVDLEAGGTKLVRVTDDGGGMGPDDLALAFAPHATSKLREAGDLDHIASLGFRGEALASIGSIAHSRIFSRRPEDEIGYEVLNDGGRIEPVREAGGAHGTIVEVRDLFFNTPARRRFLKTERTELARALDWLQRMALAHEGVAFVATHDGKRVYDVAAELDLRGRVRRTFGAELADALVPVHGQDGDTQLSGFVAPPRFARRDASRQMWFLNGRFLRDKVLVRCLRDAFHGFIDGPRYPAAFLRLAMDPARVDVNVHPTKSEVRFRDERRLFGFLKNRLREAVVSSDVATPGERLLAGPERRGTWRPSHPAQPTLPDPSAAPRPDFVVRELPGEVARPRDVAPARSGRPAPIEEVASLPDDAWQRTDELAGPFVVVDRTYIVRAVPDGFEIVDQHALHERLTFEGLKRDFAAGDLEVQRTLVPELVELDRADVALLAEHAELLAKIGIELAPLGDDTVAVHGYPARLRHPDAHELATSAVKALREKGRVPEPVELLEDVLHSAACRGSVMAGDVLDPSEIQSLLERARRLENDQTCPHGRPTRVRFTLADLEKAFHRR